MTESFGQCKQILAYLNKGNKIDAMKAQVLFNCFRLAARINDLRKRGYVILTETVRLKSGKRVARYSLVPRIYRD